MIRTKEPAPISSEICQSDQAFQNTVWDPESRYRFLGKLLQIQGELFFAFDLSEPEVFQREASSGGKSKRSRVPQYIDDWKNQFGVPVNEHKDTMQISIFDDYAVFRIDRDEERRKK